jgi:hypothetical protein
MNCADCTLEKSIAVESRFEDFRALKPFSFLTWQRVSRQPFSGRSPHGSDNTVRLTCAKTVGLVAVIDWEGMAIECDSLGLFAKVNKQFRYICRGDRKMFRRAMQFMIGIAGFEMSMIVAACEIINEAQSHDWKWKVRWTKLFDDVMIDADRKIIMFPLPIGVNFLQMEIAKVAGRVQVAVTSRGATRTFTILRSVIELMAGCDADFPFIL